MSCLYTSMVALPFVYIIVGRVNYVANTYDNLVVSWKLLWGVDGFYIDTQFVKLVVQVRIYCHDVVSIVIKCLLPH